MSRLNYFAITGLLTFITFLPLFLFLFTQGKNKVARYFSIHTLSIAVWGAGAFFVAINISKEVTMMALKISFAFGVLYIPVFLLHSILHMTNFPYKVPIMTFAYGQAILFSTLTMMDKVFEEPIRFIFNQYYWPTGKILFIISWLLWELVVGFASSVLVWHYLTSHPEKKRMLFILLIGIGLGFFGGTFNFCPAVHWDIYPYGNLLVPVFSVIVAYAVLQYKFMDIGFVLRKGSIYTLLIVLISVMYSMTMLVFEPLFARLFGEGSTLAGIMAAIILGFIYAPMRVKIELLVDSTIFKGYHQEIARQNTLMQDELVRSEKFKMVSTITRQLIYEIRNPLTAIKTHSILGSKRLENKEFLTKAFSTIDRQVERINDLLQQLLTFSNPSPPEFQKTSIHLVIEDVLNILKREFIEKKVEIVRDYHTSENELLKIDQVQMRQAVYNIVTNAVEAVNQKGGGTITLSTEIKDASRTGRLKFDESVEHYFELRIADQGVGIPAESLGSIFDPFYSLEKKKTGMGLSVTYRIIKDHGGFIFAESRLGEGATFIVELPMTLKST